MSSQPQPGRRNLLALLTTLPAATQVGTLHAAPLPAVAAPLAEALRLFVAGPADGTLNRWADALLPALEQSLPPDTLIRRVEVGSVDGVTGANQFEARSVPDGQTALLVPGRAALAWMVGDPRAQFDVAHWVAVLAGASSGVVVGRPSVLATDGRARVAAATPASPDLVALLGVQLLGANMEPVLGLATPAAAQAAFAQGAVDALLLHGLRVPEQVAALGVVGAQPLFALGALDDAGRVVRDPAFPALPHFAELYTTRTGGRVAGPLFDAWNAAAAAVRLEFGLVLPQLTPAAMVALWRRAGTDAVGMQGVQTVAQAANVRPLAGPVATTNTAVLAANAPALSELRNWLASRLNWHPA